MIRRIILLLAIIFPFYASAVDIINVEILSHADCPGTGMLMIHTENADGQLRFYLSRKANDPISQDEPLFTNLPADTYKLTVYDDNQEVIWPHDIIIEGNNTPELDVAIFVTNDINFCTDKGSVLIEISDGIPPYEIYFKGDNTDITERTKNTEWYIDGLEGGTYFCTVIDSCGSERNRTVIIESIGPDIHYNLDNINSLDIKHDSIVGDPDECGQIYIYFSTKDDNISINGNSEMAIALWPYLQYRWEYRDGSGNVKESGDYRDGVYEESLFYITIRQYNPLYKLFIIILNPCSGTEYETEVEMPNDPTEIIIEDWMAFDDGCSLFNGDWKPGVYIALTNPGIIDFCFDDYSDFFPIEVNIYESDQSYNKGALINDQFAGTEHYDSHQEKILLKTSPAVIYGAFQKDNHYIIEVTTGTGLKLEYKYHAATRGNNDIRKFDFIIERAYSIRSKPDWAQDCDIKTGYMIATVKGDPDIDPEKVYFPFNILYILDDNNGIKTEVEVEYKFGLIEKYLPDDKRGGKGVLLGYHYTIGIYYTGDKNEGICRDEKELDMEKLIDAYSLDIDLDTYDCTYQQYLIKGTLHFLLNGDTVNVNPLPISYRYYRLSAIKDNQVIYSLPGTVQSWTKVGEEATIILPEPGEWIVRWHPFVATMCTNFAHPAPVNVIKYEIPTIDLSESYFVQCNDSSEQGIVKLYVNNYYSSFIYWLWKEGEDRDDVQPVSVSFTEQEIADGDTYITLSDLEMYDADNNKIIYYIQMADERCIGDISRTYQFKLYNFTDDAAVDVYNWRGTNENRYLCEFQTDIYLEVDSLLIGRLYEYKWYMKRKDDPDYQPLETPETEPHRYPIDLITIDEYQGAKFKVEIWNEIWTNGNCGDQWLITEVALPPIRPIAETPTISAEDCYIPDGGNATLQAIIKDDYKNVNPVYTWFRNGTAVTDGNGDLINLEYLTVDVAGIYTVTIAIEDSICDSQLSDPYVISLPVMYWNGSQGDYNWNNYQNWTDTNGNPAETIPRECTVVHIPGELSNYPSLDEEHTHRRLLGKQFSEPTADKIIYHFGGETAYPHLLTYNKAYIQYNWGYYNGSYLTGHPNGNGDDPTVSQGKVMRRDSVFALAAPLKKMVSGDFSLSGYPFTWQTLYNMENPSTGELLEGSLSEPFSQNDVELKDTHHAIAIRIASYKNEIGYSDHKYLEDMKGILEFPYFENPEITQYRPGQQYNPITGESRFYYYNTETLALLNSPVGRIFRGDDAYRFVFEDDNNEVPYYNGNPCYILKVSSGNSGIREVMVGNPFMASISTRNFYEVNKDVLANDGYKVYTQGSWSQRSLQQINSSIGPLQAFVITLQDNEATLYFPLEGDHALTGALYMNGEIQTTSLLVKVTDLNETGGAYSILTTEADTEHVYNIRKFIDPKHYPLPETFFIFTGEANEYNAIHILKGEEIEVGLGIKSSDSENNLKLEFGNIEEFMLTHHLYPVLVDHYKGVIQDLSKNSTYVFQQRPVSASDQYSDKSRFSIRFVKTSTDIEKIVDQGIEIIYAQKQLHVKADKPVLYVNVYDLSGRKVFGSGNLSNSTYSYSKTLSLSKGIYIVEVKTHAGKTKSASVSVGQ